MATSGGQVSTELLENLEQMLLNMSTVVEGAWPEVWELLEGWRGALRLLRQRVHEQICWQVAQLVRSARLEEALSTTRRHLPLLREASVDKILSLAYVEAGDLREAVAFLDALTCSGVGLDEDVLFDALYQQIARNGHAHQPQMLLLKLLMDKLIASGLTGVHQHQHTYRRVQADCDRILDRVCHGIAASDCSLAHQIVEELGTRPLSMNMGYIVKVGLDLCYPM